MQGKINTIVYLLPANHTDKVQPIDAGFGKTLKAKIGESMERWLDKDNNLDKWHGTISAEKRRVLMTKWVGEAWDEVKSREHFIFWMFQKPGCLMTVDGTEDEHIKPQGLGNYTF